MNDIPIQRLTKEAFAPYGDILTLKPAPDKLINQGLCGRHHDLALMDFGLDGRAGISLFDATPRSLPLCIGAGRAASRRLTSLYSHDPKPFFSDCSAR